MARLTKEDLPFEIRRQPAPLANLARISRSTWRRGDNGRSASIASISTLSSARVSSSSRSRMMRPCWVRYPLKCGALGFLSSSNVIGGFALPCQNFGDFDTPFRARRVTLGGAGRLRGGTARVGLGLGGSDIPPN